MQEDSEMRQTDSRDRSFDLISSRRRGVILATFLALACGAASAFTVDAEIPAGNAIVNAIDGDTVSIRQDLRDTKGEWFYWAFRVKGAAGRTVRFDFRKPDGTALDIVGVRGPVVSTDGGKTFSYPLDGKATARGFTYTFAPDENETLFYEIGRAHV